MTSSNKASIQRYYSLNPKQYPVLASLVIKQDVSLWGDPPDLSIDIRLKSSDPKNTQILELKFFGVRSLILKQPNWSVFQMSLIEISSMSDRNWEGINYSVKESEEQSVSFICRSFDVDVIDEE